jgi:meso-butanediol dehydrogenase / (S,S)-butanediol dehydrogenase / diacetyl reductase
MRLDGKMAIITGGGTGIGAAIAKLFVLEGAKVCIMGRRKEMLNAVLETLPQGSVIACKTDIADAGDVDRTVAAALAFGGKIDVIVNNAGVGAIGGVAGHDIDLWRETLATNLTGPFLLMRASIPHMIRDGGGSLIHISSVAGVRSVPESAAYCTSKAGLIMLAQQVALDYGRHGIRSNAVCPGWVRTPMSEHEMDELGGVIGKDREETFAIVVKDLPLGRVATPEEIARVCLFLASDESSFITGAVIMVDGGSAAVDVGTLAYKADS